MKRIIFDSDDGIDMILFYLFKQKLTKEKSKNV